MFGEKKKEVRDCEVMRTHSGSTRYERLSTTRRFLINGVIRSFINMSRICNVVPTC